MSNESGAGGLLFGELRDGGTDSLSAETLRAAAEKAEAQGAKPHTWTEDDVHGQMTVFGYSREEALSFIARLRGATKPDKNTHQTHEDSI